VRHSFIESIASTSSSRASAPRGRLHRVLPWDGGARRWPDVHTFRESVAISWPIAFVVSVGEPLYLADTCSDRRDIWRQRGAGDRRAQPDR